MTHLLIPERFNGPPHSANGGWFAGSVAQRVHAATGAAEGTAVRVRLMAPPPLERPLTLAAHGEHFSIEDGATQIASAALAADLSASPQAPVSYAEAQAVATAYEGLSEHPFPTCFSCGPAREDGLGLRPGRLPGRNGTYAAAWAPTETSVPIAWAALDCPGGWSAGIAGRPMVLGTMTAQVHRLPEVGEPCVIMAWPLGGQGRRFDSTTALIGADGELLGRADAVWIAVDPARVRPQ